jgi:hypothetical protein
MRRLVTLVMLAIFSMTSSAVKADGVISVYPAQAQPIPTTPQVPAPQAEAVQPPAVPVQAAPGQVAGNCNNCSTNKKNCLQKFCAWVTYRPSSGDALPLFKVAPYTGPFTGTFLCTPAPGSPCAGGNGNSSCGKKQGCVSENSPLPSGPVVEKGNPAMRVLNVVPQVAQGFPSRGCQGGSVQLSDPTFPGSTRAVPETPDYSGVQETAVPLENGEFKPISYTNNCNPNGSQYEFIAAVMIGRQVQTPIDLITRTNLRP